MRVFSLRVVFKCLVVHAEFVKCGESDVCDLLMFVKDKSAPLIVLVVRQRFKQCCGSRKNK